MKKITHLIKSFTLTIFFLLLILISINILIYILLFHQTVQNFPTPVPILEQTSESLKYQEGEYRVENDIQVRLTDENIWGMLIDNETGGVIWAFHLPQEIPNQFGITDIAQFSGYYLQDYPVFTWEHQDGLLVLGYPKDSYTKIKSFLPLSAIKNMPALIILIIVIDILILLSFYLFTTRRINRSISPIVEGITDLSAGKVVELINTEPFLEITESINRTSKVLQEKNNALLIKEKNREKWIEGVSHDIRTPLSIILGYSEKLKNIDSLNEVDLQHANVIAAQSIIIKELIENLNLVSHLESNGLDILLSTISPLKVVRQIITEILNRDLNEKYQIHFKVGKVTGEIKILGEASLLKRAISNLILNSMKHNPGGCEIYVTIKEQLGVLEIIVEDTGKGLSPEYLKEITAFFTSIQNNSVLKNRKGLGLLIVKEILDIHKGKINISCPKDSGLKTVLSFLITV